jgi:thiamine biosynthesis lipoprotein
MSLLSVRNASTFLRSIRRKLAPSYLIERQFLAMGTPISVKLALHGKDRKVEAEGAISDVCDLISDFGRDGWAWGSGALARINRMLAAGDTAQIPAQLKPLLVRAWEIRQATGGLFEPRIAALVRLWGFDDVARTRTSPPDECEIESLLAALRAAPDYHGGNTYGPAPGVAWDLGGIGKGYIIDAALDILCQRGFTDAVVDAGGNLAVRGTRHDQPWHVGIRDPRSAAHSPQLLAALDTHNEAVITHGDDQRYFDYGGRRYSHILDPVTGTPVSGLSSLTVVHRDGTLADAAGAALFIAGRDGWKPLAARLRIDQVLVVTSDGLVQATAPLARRLKLRDDLGLEIVH